VHVVRAGDTLALIAYEYDSSLQCLLDANGLTRDSLIFEGQEVRVCILVTLTPTLTLTGGPDSTATPTPTPVPPALLAPANGASIARNRPVILQWAAARPLLGNQHYLVIVRNVTQDTELRETTRETSFRLPADWQPGLGQSAQFEWQVVIVGSDDPTALPISGPGVVWTFTWG
jgi:hypothetical protein